MSLADRRGTFARDQAVPAVRGRVRHDPRFTDIEHVTLPEETQQDRDRLEMVFPK